MKKLFIFFLIFFLTSCTKEAQVELPYVSYMPVKISERDSSNAYQGFIDRGLDVNLSFGLSGTIDGLYVTEGDYVKKGKLLAKIDNDEYKFEISRAKSELDNALVKYNQQKSYFERISKLYKAGGISYNDWENAQTNLKSGENQIKILKNGLNIAQNKETFSNIYAPSDGYIIKTYKDNGQFAQAGETVMLFQGNGMLEARVFAPQKDINLIKKDQKAVITTEAAPYKTYLGKVKSRTNTSINEGAYRVTITFDENYPELLDGMSVSVKINSNGAIKGIFIPINSVLSDVDKKYIFILEKTGENTGLARKREVKTGGIYDGLIEIKEGLKTGELVITGGVNKIMDKNQVRFL